MCVEQLVRLKGVSLGGVQSAGVWKVADGLDSQDLESSRLFLNPCFVLGKMELFHPISLIYLVAHPSKSEPPRRRLSRGGCRFTDNLATTQGAEQDRAG